MPLRIPYVHSGFLCIALFMTVCLFPWRYSFALDRQSYCSGVYQCLQEKPDLCPEDLCKKDPHVDYDDDFCAIFRELQARGLDPHSYWGRRIYSYLAKRYRVVYEVQGTLPLSADVLRYLLDHVPFSAQLVNAYTGTRYRAHYVDRERRKFRGDNNDGITGVFSLVLHDTDRMRRVYFGYGTAEVLLWKLYGVALMVLDMEPDGSNAVTYRLRCLVFPAKGWLKTVMNFMLFRKVVTGKIEEIIGAINASVASFHAGNTEPIRNHASFATPAGRHAVNLFREVITAPKVKRGKAGGEG